MVNNISSKINLKTNNSNIKLTLVHLTENLFTLSVKYFGNTSIKPILKKNNKERHYLSVQYEEIKLNVGTKLNKSNTSLKKESFTIVDIELSKNLGFIFELK